MLKLIKRSESPYWQIQGTIYLGPGETVAVRQSSRCIDRRSAEVQAQRLEQRIHDEYRGKSDSVNNSFRDATLAYLNTKGAIHPNDAGRLQILNEYFGSANLRDIDGGAFLSFCNRHLGGVSNETINRYRSNLTAVLNHAKAIWPDAIVRKIPRRKVRTPKPRYLSLEEQERLLNAYHPLVRPIVHVLCFQGSRVGETIRLRWPDVDMDRGSITYWDTKNGDFRVVPMHPRVRETLMHINRERQGPVFLTHMGMPYRYDTDESSSTFKTAHRTALRRAGISNFKIHNWRSHWASHMAMKGSNVYELMSLGGWRDPKSVNHYVKLDPQHLRQAIERLK